MRYFALFETVSLLLPIAFTVSERCNASFTRYNEMSSSQPLPLTTVAVTPSWKLMETTVLSPNEQAELDNAARRELYRLYAFGESDPAIQNATLKFHSRLSSHNTHCAVYHVGRDPEYAGPIPNMKPPSSCPDRVHYALEGAAGIGKTTMLGRQAGGDLNELRRGPWGLLAGTTDDFAYFRLAARIMMAGDNQLQDRSDWMASLIYNAYYRGFIFLFEDQDLRDFVKNITPYEILVIDDPEISDSQLHARIIARGGMDSGMDEDYTVITRRLFQLVAEHYNLRTLTTTQAAALISASGNSLAHSGSIVSQQQLAAQHGSIVENSSDHVPK
jgi:hypothetical protein